MDRQTIADLQPVGQRVGAGIRFFHPERAFYTYLRKFRDNLLIDVGAGSGHVALALAAASFQVQAIDLYDREDSVWAVELANAVVYPFPSNSVPLFCRPCHGEFFVSPAIEQAVECGVTTILYAGFPKRVADDLGRWRKRARRVCARVGRDRECLYEVTIRAS